MSTAPAQHNAIPSGDAVLGGVQAFSSEGSVGPAVKPALVTSSEETPEPTNELFVTIQVTPPAAEPAAERPTQEQEREVQTVRVRVLEPVTFCRQVQTLRSVGSALLGRGTTAERIVFNCAVKSRIWTHLLRFIWWIGLGAGVIVLFTGPENGFAWASMLMLPMPIFISLVFAIDVLRCLIQQFELYLVLVLQINVFLSALVLTSDSRRIFWACFLPSMLVSTFMDAYPSKYRPLFSRIFFLGVGIVYVIWLMILAWRWGPPLQDRRVALLHFEGRIASGAVAPLCTLLAFCFRHGFTSFMYPDRMVIIRSACRTRHISRDRTVHPVSDPDQAYASQAIQSQAYVNDGEESEDSCLSQRSPSASVIDPKSRWSTTSSFHRILRSLEVGLGRSSMFSAKARSSTTSTMERSQGLASRTPEDVGAEREPAEPNEQAGPVATEAGPQGLTTKLEPVVLDTETGADEDVWSRATSSGSAKDVNSHPTNNGDRARGSLSLRESSEKRREVVNLCRSDSSSIDSPRELAIMKLVGVLV